MPYPRGTGTIDRIGTVEKPSKRRSGTVVVVLLTAVAGVLALATLPIFLGGDDCGGEDCPDLVTRRGTEYVVAFECDPVRVELRRSPEDGVFNPALSGASQADVSTFAIASLPADEVIAVEGPRDLVCPNGPVPGQGVAFSSETSAAVTSRRIATMIQR